MGKIIHGHAGCGYKEAGGSPTYISWVSMRKRCGDPSHEQYFRYGGRGITVCDRWLNSFENFLADMGERPADKFLERKNNNGNYEPDNCVWATRSEQSRNRRNNHLITYNGITQPLCAWAEQLGISRLTLRSRLREKWTIEHALTVPTRNYHYLTFHNLTLPIAEWAKRFHLKRATLAARVRRGLTPEQCLLGE